MTDVLALDLATTTGYARGRVGSIPVAGTVCFASSSSASDNAIFGAALCWISELLLPTPRPDMIVIEALLPPGAMVGMTSRVVRDRLIGLHGIVRAVSHLRSVHNFHAVSVGDIRAHFIGDRNLPRAVAKRETIARCRALGWTTGGSNDAADALAAWSYGCSMIDAQTALNVVPLFNEQLRAAE